MCSFDVNIFKQWDSYYEISQVLQNTGHYICKNIHTVQPINHLEIKKILQLKNRKKKKTQLLMAFFPCTAMQ